MRLGVLLTMTLLLAHVAAKHAVTCWRKARNVLHMMLHARSLLRP